MFDCVNIIAKQHSCRRFVDDHFFDPGESRQGFLKWFGQALLLPECRDCQLHSPWGRLNDSYKSQCQNAFPFL